MVDLEWSDLDLFFGHSSLSQVYLTLCCALGASAVGVYLHMLMNIGGILTFLGCTAGIFWLTATPPYEEVKRLLLLLLMKLICFRIEFWFFVRAFVKDVGAD